MRRMFCLALLLLLGNCKAPAPEQLAAQIVGLLPQTEEVPAYPFLREEANRIVEADRRALASFREAMQDLVARRRKKVRIVHIGDSHIQADFFSGQVRKRFQQIDSIGNGGRGYLFPCALAQAGNDPFTVKILKKGTWEGCRNIQKTKECDWGIAGMTAATSDEQASFELQPYANGVAGGYTSTKVKLYYPTDQAAYFAVRLWTGQFFLSPHRLYREGYAEFLLPLEIRKVGITMQRQSLAQNYFSFSGISLENDQYGLIYSAAGVNGAKVSSFLRNPLLETQLRAESPDLVIVSLGTNDSYMPRFDKQAFEKECRALIAKIRSASPQASIVFTGPPDNQLKGMGANPHVAQVQNILLQLAKEENLGFWPLYDIMGGFKSIEKWQKAALAAADGVHFTRKGYYLQGDLLFEALMKACW